MTLALTILAAPFVMLVFVAVGYRRRWIAAEQRGDTAEQIACDALDAKRAAMAERDYWQTACRRSYGTSYSLTDAQVARLYRGLRDGFADELPPSDLPIGTSANPILCARGDVARYSSLADLMGAKP